MGLLDNWRAWPRSELGLIHFQGADTVSFLQGQLSNDLSLLQPGQPLLAGYHNPQGRAIAVLWLLQRAADDVIALLPPERVGPVTSRLSRFVLRSKVRISEEPSSLFDEAAYYTEPATAHAWRLAGITAGLPQVYAATSESFVAQMLNLDLLGGVSFEKGCYTGQEVIARAHFRGKVKRRMQRFLTEEPADLKPGEAGTLPDGRSFRIVDAAQRADGRCEFLAVAALTAGATVETDSAADDAAASDQSPLAAQALPLPYTLPD